MNYQAIFLEKFESKKNRKFIQKCFHFPWFFFSEVSNENLSLYFFPPSKVISFLLKKQVHADFFLKAQKRDRVF